MKIFDKLVSYNSFLYQKAFKFSIRIMHLFKYLSQKDKSYDPIYKQLLRSGTSIGANVSEAQSASSKKDFVNKLSLALKESRETEYWIKLLIAAELLTLTEFDSLNNDCDELERLLTSSIKTAKGE